MAWKSALVALAIAALGLGSAAAAEEKPANATPDQLVEALKGFKGFLAGDVVDRKDTGIVLFVRSITLVEGSQAKNPGILLSREATVQYATEKDEKGNERPMKSLVSLMARLEKLPVFTFGGAGGGNVMIGVDDGAGAGVNIQRMTIKATTVQMEMNGQRIKVGGDEEKGARKVEKPKGPAATVRVTAGGDGKLVADRGVPGLQPAATWDGMARVEFEDIKPAGEPQKKEGKEPKDAQF